MVGVSGSGGSMRLLVRMVARRRTCVRLSKGFAIMISGCCILVEIGFDVTFHSGILYLNMPREFVPT